LPLGKAVGLHVGQRRLREIVKLALDVWYALWEDVGNEGGPGPDRRPDEKDRYYTWVEDEKGRYYPWVEDYQAWIRD
jgi:hypothetical protein